MSIVFNDDTLAVWYALLDPAKMDYMGALSRRDYGYMYTWRMRYYASPDDPWDEEDRKSWYSVQIPSARGDVEQVVKLVREMVVGAVALGRAMGKPEPGPIYELIRGEKTFEAFTDEFMNAPFVHARKQELH